jgi:hypothetical protein
VAHDAISTVRENVTLTPVPLAGAASLVQIDDTATPRLGRFQISGSGRMRKSSAPGILVGDGVGPAPDPHRELVDARAAGELEAVVAFDDGAFVYVSR